MVEEQQQQPQHKYYNIYFARVIFISQFCVRHYCRRSFWCRRCHCHCRCHRRCRCCRTIHRWLVFVHVIFIRLEVFDWSFYVIVFSTFIVKICFSLFLDCKSYREPDVEEWFSNRHSKKKNREWKKRMKINQQKMNDPIASRNGDMLRKISQSRKSLSKWTTIQPKH